MLISYGAIMGIAREKRIVYEFGPFTLDVSARRLIRDGEEVSVQSKLFDMLVLLVENRGRVIRKDELLDHLWPDSFVEEGSLSQNIFQLRKILGDIGQQHVYIKTVPKRGYLFVAQVEERDGEIIDLQPSGDADDNTSEDHPEKALSLTLRGSASRKKAIILMSIVVLASTLSFAIYRFINSRPSERAFLPQNLRLSKVTSEGASRRVAISPDGKVVAYILEKDGKQSLWIRQVASTSVALAVPPNDMLCRGLTFSAEGHYIYYLAYLGASNMGVVYRVPVLGGIPEKILEDVDSPVSFSPDGKQMAFVRNYPNTNETALMVVEADGKNERRLSARKAPLSYLLGGPAWSPDGKVIACAARGSDSRGFYMSIAGISPVSGEETPLSELKWNSVGQIAWLGDGRAIGFVGWYRESCVLADQIWQISYPEGEAARVTRDLSAYRGLSIARDFNAIVSIQSHRNSQICVASENDGFDQCAKITRGFGDSLSARLGLAELPDGRIVYASTASGNIDLWMMNADGSNPRQLTFHDLGDYHPQTTPDGKNIVFVSERNGYPNLWRMPVDAGDLSQITRGAGEVNPAISPDGKWVVYYSAGDIAPGLWKVSIDGGEPLRLSDQLMSSPVISPDGKMIACLYLDEASSRMKTAIIAFDGEEPAKILRTFPDLDLASETMRWTGDSKALTYIVTRNGVSNIWSQPLDGSPAKQLTRFETDLIFRYVFSADGKRLICERGYDLNDAVLILDE